ncbi:hypothetical protein EH30_00240 [Erythrobacter sp. JL475]|jgi:hypothetical protein|nr:hypothetical protein EH30_00240 [Erythrobacter sp. JL475]
MANSAIPALSSRDFVVFLLCLDIVFQINAIISEKTMVSEECVARYLVFAREAVWLVMFGFQWANSRECELVIVISIGRNSP